MDYFAASRHPERGLPVAGRPAVINFLQEMLRTRRAMVIALLGLHALAAITGLVVPRILGSMVDQAAEPGTSSAV